MRYDSHPELQGAIPLETFHAFGWIHAAALAIFLSATVVLVRTRRDMRADPVRAVRLDRVVGVLALCAWVFSIGTDIVPARFDLRGSLPLQLCDLAGLVAPVAILTNRRWARALLHYWGLGLSTQAMITPTLTDGPATLEFWCFWAAHTAVVGTAAYDFLARGFRPTWRDFQTVGFYSAAYLPLVLLVDLPLGLNYGFVGNANSDQPTVLDHLGPWPERLLLIWLLVALLLFGMTWPWELWRWMRDRKDAKVSPALSNHMRQTTRASRA